MRTLLLPSTLLLLLAAGCAGPSGSTSPASGAALASSQGLHAKPSTVSQEPWLYVAGNSNSTVDAYNLSRKNYPLSVSITSGIANPVGITIGPKGRLYVTNGNNTISEYPFGQTVPIVTLQVSNPVSDALNPLVDELYVATRGNPPGIGVYHPNDSQPRRYIVSPLLTKPGQIAFDSTGTLYIADQVGGVSMIEPYTYKVKSLHLKDLLPCPTGVALDPTTSSLFVSSCDGGAQVYAIGNALPVRELNLPFTANYLASGSVKNQVEIFAPDSTSNTVDVFNDSTSNPIATITTGAMHAAGVAVKPANVPPPN